MKAKAKQQKTETSQLVFTMTNKDNQKLKEFRYRVQFS